MGKTIDTKVLFAFFFSYHIKPKRVRTSVPRTILHQAAKQHGPRLCIVLVAGDRK